MKNKKSKKQGNRQPKKNSNNKQVIVYREKPMSIGAQIGDKLQQFGTSLVSRILGRGDYQVSDNISDIKKNTMMDRPPVNKMPQFDKTKSSFIIEHSEYVGDVISSSNAGAYGFNSYTINPGNAQLFPWLSTVATNFEAYQIEGMLFRYESTSGNAISGTNAALGNVMAYVQYDVSDNVPTSKNSLLQYEGVSDCKTSENLLVGVECDPSRLPLSRLYVSAGNTPTGYDQHLYNFGNLIVATQGQQQAFQNCGELWVHYRIRFFVTKIPEDSAPGGVVLSSTQASTSTTSALFNTVTKTTGNLYAVSTDNVNTFGWAPSYGQVYMVSLYVYSNTTGTITAPSLTLTGLANGPNKFNGYISNYVYTQSSGVSPTQFLGNYIVTAQPLQSTGRSSITFTGGAYPANSSVTLIVTRLDNYV